MIWPTLYIALYGLLLTLFSLLSVVFWRYIVEIQGIDIFQFDLRITMDTRIFLQRSRFGRLTDFGNFFLRPE